MTPLTLLAYRAATALAAPSLPLVLARRARRGKEDPERLSERLGRAEVLRPAGPLVWLHGASVGEGLSLLPLIERFRSRRPDLTLLLTTGTVAAATVLAPRLPPGVLHRYAPVDAPGPARRFMASWRPDLAVFAESDLWPNLVLEAETAGARLALISARLSAASLRRWSRAPASARRLLGAFSLMMAQDEATAGALERLGGRDDGRLNLKRYTAPPPFDPAAVRDLRAEAGGRRIVLAASTHPGEEEIVLTAAARLPHPTLLVLAPRHPARAESLAEAVGRTGLTVARRSRGEGPGRADVYLADTLGEMGLLYALADVSIVGGSLVPGPGGHNPLEPALLGCPMLTGPNVANWSQIYDELTAAGGVGLVRDAGELREALIRAAERPEAERARAAAARSVALSARTHLEAAAERLLELIR